MVKKILLTQTTIVIDKFIRDELFNLKKDSSDTYNKVIERLLKK